MSDILLNQIKKLEHEVDELKKYCDYLQYIVEQDRLSIKLLCEKFNSVCPEHAERINFKDLFYDRTIDNAKK